MDQAQPQYAYLQVTAEAHGLHPMILGYGKRTWWPEGLGAKINALRSFVHGPLPVNDVVVFVDAFDVSIFGDEAEILERFAFLERATNRSLVFNCEQVCFPNFPDICDRYPPSGGALFHHLNSGTMAGRVHAFRHMLAEPVPDVIPGSDQAWYHRYYLAHQDQIALDTKCLLVCAIMGDDEEHGMRWEGDRLAQVYSGNKPSVIHFVSLAHWPVWKDGRSTSTIHEAFRKLHPDVAERLLETIRFTVHSGSVYTYRKTLAANSSEAFLYQAYLRSLECVACVSSSSPRKTCETTGPCAPRIAKLMVLPAVLVVALAWRCRCWRRPLAKKVSADDCLEEGKEPIREPGAVASLGSLLLGFCPGWRRQLLPQKRRLED